MTRDDAIYRQSVGDRQSDYRPSCPTCGTLNRPGRFYCEDCGAGLYLRARWFCSYCGALTQAKPSPRDGRVRCAAHRDLLEPVPSDPLESLPMQAAQLREAVPPSKEREDHP